MSGEEIPYLVVMYLLFIGVVVYSNKGEK